MDKNIRDITKLRYYEVSQKNPIEMKLGKTTRKKLYHYTTSAGAKGILESNTLFATQSNYLDDVTEIRYISTVLKGVVMYLKQNEKLYDKGVAGYSIIYEAIIETFEGLSEIYKYGAPISGSSLYLLSLTENKNNKYLYENYCRKDGHNGAVLEFRNNVDDMFKHNKHVMCIGSARVEYHLKRQMTSILKDINEFYAEILTTLVNEETIVDYVAAIETVRRVIEMKVMNYSFFFKHVNYAKEEEYRAVFLIDDPDNIFVKHRTILGIKKPYIELNFKPESLIKTKYID
ncbi:DUF2971 domain-containing protein [Clostridium sp. FP1]|uniref:DUF2971 domain-containing protein n=1 Tax=Clostridium sp. FP1 TaxID=2724076 RepID=UPI0013E924DB|nr:DUF2971 domain-containing protein [Clostridium sp. FP1]MBZ9634625.1 hypothetical protein [Clostridium sp. FP1]